MDTFRKLESLVFLLVLPFGVISLTFDEATAQIRKEIKRTGEHSQQLDFHLTGLVQDVRTLVDNQGHLHCHHRGVEYGCRIPSVLPSGQIEEAVDWFDQKMLFFQCNTGFVLVGSPSLVCTEGRWNDSFPKCAAADCKAHQSRGHNQDGMYGIMPDGQTPILAYCDMTKDGGGWTVFQRRVDNSVNFYRTYTEYQKGFGNIKSNFWLGLEALHSLTQAKSELYVDMVANETHSAYARYSSFAVGDAASGYGLSVSGYKGTAGDSFSGHNGMKFSTYDKDQDTYTGDCAKAYKGGWWYSACHSANLNGLYLNGSHPDIYAKGINWYALTGHHYSLRSVEMKIRRME